MITSQPFEQPASNVSGTDLSLPDARERLDRAADRARALAQRGADAVRDSSLQLRDAALRASDSTLGYVRQEPVKSILIAAAAGAVLMALVGLVARSRYPS